MSSAKTIADILAFAELIDAKSFIGNPFTSQPMYIAACAFLAEIASYSSLPSTPIRTSNEGGSLERREQEENKPKQNSSNQRSSHKLTAKYSLLASAANQNYQRCYKALKSLETYWAGTRYILTALDQKSKGIMDPLLYTSEDVESAIEVPRQVPLFSTPGWRQSLAHSHSFPYPNTGLRSQLGSSNSRGSAFSPTIDPGQAIGWSLTGTMNSPNPSLSFLYSTPHVDQTQLANITSTPFPAFDRNDPNATFDFQQSQRVPSDTNMISLSHFPPIQADRLSEAGLLLGLHSPGSTSDPSMSAQAPHNYPTSTFQSTSNIQHPPLPGVEPNLSQTSINNNTNTLNQLSQPYSDMMIQSQDIEVTGQQGNLAFQGGEMLPWLEYLPPGVLSWFGEPNELQQSQQQQQPHPP